MIDLLKPQTKEEYLALVFLASMILALLLAGGTFRLVHALGRRKKRRERAELVQEIRRNHADPS